jgi:hypothetical protein
MTTNSTAGSEELTTKSTKTTKDLRMNFNVKQLKEGIKRFVL